MCASEETLQAHSIMREIELSKHGLNQAQGLERISPPSQEKEAQSYDREVLQTRSCKTEAINCGGLDGVFFEKRKTIFEKRSSTCA